MTELPDLVVDYTIPYVGWHRAPTTWRQRLRCLLPFGRRGGHRRQRGDQ